MCYVEYDGLDAGNEGFQYGGGGGDLWGSVDMDIIVVKGATYSAVENIIVKQS